MIPLAEISGRATEVTAALLALDAQLEPSASIVRIEQDLPGVSERLAERLHYTRGTSESGPRLESLDSLAQSWRSSRIQLGEWLDKLKDRGSWLESQRVRLASTEQTWRATQRSAAGQELPAPVTARIGDVLASLPPALQRVEAQAAANLVLEDRVAQEIAHCDEALDTIDRARRQARGELFRRDSPPVWELRPRELGAVGPAIGAALTTDLARLRRFASDEAGRIALHVALLIALVALLQWVDRERRRIAPASGEPPAHTLLDQPVAAAVLFALLASGPIYEDPPRLLWLLLSVAALVPVAAILRRAVAPRLVPVVFGLAAFFLVDRIRDFITFMPFVERLLFVVEMGVGAAVIAWLGWWHPARIAYPAGSAFRLVFRAHLIRAAFAGLTIAFVAAAIGAMSFARVLAAGILGTAYFALFLSAGRRVADELFDFALRIRPLHALRMVQLHGPLIARRGHALLYALSSGTWALLSLGSFGLLAPALSAARRTLTAELAVGTLRISSGEVLAFALTVWAAFAFAAFVRFVLEEDVFPRLSLSAGLPYALSSLTGYVIVTLGFIVALFALGLNLDRVTVLGGAFGVGVGFGLQNVVNNFVSGLIVLFERPIHVGDEVQIGNVQGEVRRIGIRSCTIRIGEGAEVIVPNSQLVAERVTNWTPAQRLRRLAVPVRVAYGSAPDAVIGVLTAVAQGCDGVVNQPPPRALFLGFGESALLFELRAWTHRLDDVSGVQSELGVAVWGALRDAGLAIPLPQQQEVRLNREPSP